MGTWTAPTNRATGISGATLNSGANALSGEIDNETNKDRYLALELTFTCATAAAVGATVQVFIVYAMDGTLYEDGSTAPLDPAKTPIGVFVNRFVTTAQKQSIVGIPIFPFKFKVLLANKLGQNATSVDLDAETYNEPAA